MSAVTPKQQAEVEMQKLIESAGSALITLRFTQLKGVDWARLTSQHPPRLGVAVDETYAYNYDAVTLEAARFVDAAGRHYGVRIEDGVEVPLLVEPKTDDNPNPVDEWADLIEVLSGHDLRNLRNTVWGLNEYLPQLQKEAMGKAFGATGRSEKN